jgi:hypothetical protein
MDILKRIGGHGRGENTGKNMATDMRKEKVGGIEAEKAGNIDG